MVFIQLLIVFLAMMMMVMRMGQVSPSSILAAVRLEKDR